MCVCVCVWRFVHEVLTKHRVRYGNRFAGAKHGVVFCFFLVFLLGVSVSCDMCGRVDVLDG